MRHGAHQSQDWTPPCLARASERLPLTWRRHRHISIEWRRRVRGAAVRCHCLAKGGQCHGPRAGLGRQR
eukprot:scaffold41415_cov264-Isochrysis_galbana.AAC.4